MKEKKSKTKYFVIPDGNKVDLSLNSQNTI